PLISSLSPQYGTNGVKVMVKIPQLRSQVVSLTLSNGNIVLSLDASQSADGFSFVFPMEQALRNLRVITFEVKVNGLAHKNLTFTWINPLVYEALTQLAEESPFAVLSSSESKAVLKKLNAEERSVLTRYDAFKQLPFE